MRVGRRDGVVWLVHTMWEGRRRKGSRTHPAVVGSIAILPAKTAAATTMQATMTVNDVFDVRCRCPRLKRSMIRATGNSVMTVNQTRENLRIVS